MRLSVRLPLVASLALAVPLHAGGETITVTTVEDRVDAAGSSLADLPGPDGVVSFREALAVANSDPGAQTIAFAIPPSEFWLSDSEALLRLEDGAFSLTGDRTTLDFSSQADAFGDTNPNGCEVGIYGLQANGWGIAAIFVSGDDCVIKGLGRVMQRGYGLDISGSRNRVIGCEINGSLYAGVAVEGFPGSPAVDNVIGGTEPGEGNILSGGNAGIRVDGPSVGTVVIGNVLVGSPYAGIQVRGAYCCPDYTPMNTRIGGPTPEESNWIAGNGSFGEEGFPLGTQVEVEWALNTIVEGNTIGTTQDGLAAFGGSGVTGVGIRESDTTIVRDNQIAGMRKEGVNHYDGDVFGVGISVWGPNTGVEITNNLIGTDATGTGAIPNYSGLSFSWFQGYPSGAAVGGSAPEDANVIAFNETYGIAVANGIEGVTVEGNSIHSNGGLGIDLFGAAGVTPNDPGDADVGANGLQNFPELLAATGDETSVHVVGSLDSTPGTQFSIDVYASAECDASGNGEGERHLGSFAVTTDGAGQAAIDATLTALAADGEFVTATATEVATGNTSEFSACIELLGFANPFHDMGFGTAGVSGIPALSGSGSLLAGEPTTFATESACPEAPALMIVGGQSVLAPLAGGTLVPMPQVMVPMVTDAAGASSLTAPWPSGLPSGAVIYAQQWIVDAAAPGGFSATNALEVEAP